MLQALLCRGEYYIEELSYLGKDWKRGEKYQDNGGLAKHGCTIHVVLLHSKVNQSVNTHVIFSSAWC